MTCSQKVSAMPSVLLGAVAYTYWDYAKYVLLGVMAILISVIIVKLVKVIRSIVQNFGLQDIDTMDGISFECYIAEALRNNGYINICFTEQYDYGVDIIARKDGILWGIQVKRYAELVKADAVRQVVTGLRLYGCDRAMVITNSTFSTVAQRLAEGNDCVLIDRAGLYRLIR